MQPRARAIPEPPGEVIGVLGGMGPAATADFYAKLVALTPAARDQDHPQVVIWSDPTTPDRTLALLGNGPDPSEWLVRGARSLAAAGATVLAIPCNTAHAFLPSVERRLGLPVVHMIGEVARCMQADFPGVRRAGLLATSGTLAAGLYQEWLAPVGIDTLAPQPGVQERCVMPAIRAVKAGDVERSTQLLLAAAGHLRERGAELLIAGCTEVPLGLPSSLSPLPLIDPATVLARALLRRAGLDPRPSAA